MDIEDVNEIFNADRLSRKLTLKFTEHLQRAMPTIIERKPPELTMDDKDISGNIYTLTANFTVLFDVIAEFVAQNNLTLWQTAEHYFVSKEYNP
jgi:hypothetical protein